MTKRALTTPENVEVIPQCGNFGNIADLDTENFSISGKNFLIKNETDDAVWLEVKPSQGDSFVNTKFNANAWGTELVKEVKADATLTADQLANLKWGM